MKPGTRTKPTLQKGKLVQTVSFSMTAADVKYLDRLGKALKTKNRSELLRIILNEFSLHIATQ